MKGDFIMSEREMARQLLDNVPVSKLGYVIAYLQGITADEASDDRFCEKLLNDYRNDPERGEYVSFEEMAKMSGVDINGL